MSKHIEPATLTVHNRLMAAISILQVIMLSKDSMLSPEVLWGGMFIPEPALEQAIAVLLEILPDVENI